MPLQLSCSCGRSLQVPDDLAGRRVRCPACLAVTVAPDGEIPEARLVDPPKAVAAAKPRAAWAALEILRLILLVPALGFALFTAGSSDPHPALILGASGLVVFIALCSLGRATLLGSGRALIVFSIATLLLISLSSPRCAFRPGSMSPAWYECQKHDCRARMERVASALRIQSREAREYPATLWMLPNDVSGCARCPSCGEAFEVVNRPDGPSLRCPEHGEIPVTPEEK